MDPQANTVNILSIRCKCCFDDGVLTELWAEYLCNGERENYGEMLAECFAIPWEPPSDYAEQICWACIERVRDAYFFKKKILDTQKVLEDLADSTTVKEEMDSYVLKTETEAEKLTSTLQEMLDDQVEQQADTSQESNIEMEYIDEYGEINSEELPEDYRVSEAGDSNNDGEEFFEVEYLEEDQNGQLVKQNTSTSNTTQKPGARRKRDTYRKYTDSQLQKCLEAVKNSTMTRLEASFAFGVPVKTISSKLRAEVANENKSGDGQTTELAADDKTVEPDQIEDVSERDSAATETVPPQLTKVTTYTYTNYQKINMNYQGKVKITESAKLYSNVQAILLNSNATPIRGHWGIGYGCAYCKNQYPNPLDLKQHTLSVHTDIIGRYMAGKNANEFVVKLDVTELTCDLCDKEVGSFESLLEHLENAHDVTIYKDVNNHILPFNFGPNTEVLKCVVCAAEFNYFKLLSEHMNDHYKNFECTWCGRGFINKSSFRVHSYRHKYGEFPCSYCSKTFDTKVKKREHERVVHLLRSKAHRCGYCDERFGDSRAKNKHESIVHRASPKVFACHACESIFYRQRALTDHINEYHLQVKPFSCYGCDKTFAKRQDFDKHVVVHNTDNEFQCDLCTLNFKTSQNLEEHMRIHADEKRYPCPHCESTFVQKNNLLNHIKFQHKESVDDVSYETEISDISTNYVMKLMEEEL